MGDYDGLDNAEVFEQLPKLGKGRYTMSFETLEYSETPTGKFVIVTVAVDEASEDAALKAGDRTKLWFERGLASKSPKGQRADKQFANFLLALNGGAKPDSLSEFAAELAANPDSAKGSKFGVTATEEMTKNAPIRPFLKKTYFAVAA